MRHPCHFVLATPHNAPHLQTHCGPLGLIGFGTVNEFVQMMVVRQNTSKDQEITEAWKLLHYDDSVKNQIELDNMDHEEVKEKARRQR